MHLYAWLLACTASVVFGQEDVTECGLNCIADVSGTECSQSDWTCLCQSSSWLERTDSCAQSACNSTQYDTTIASIAELCVIVSEPVTVQPYVTVASSLFDQPFSTVGFSTGSLRPLNSGTETATSSADVGSSILSSASDIVSSASASASDSASSLSSIAATATAMTASTPPSSSTSSSGPAATSSNQSPQSSISTTLSYILAGMFMMFALYL